MKINITIFTIILMAFILSSCKPTYEPPSASPEMETMAADVPYEMDFVQINNDVIEYYGEGPGRKIFPFIKNMDIDGDNDNKSIILKLEVMDGVSDDAIQFLVTDVAKQIANECQLQDFRFKQSSQDSLGTAYDVYSFSFVVERGEETVYDEHIGSGENFPFDVTLDGNAVNNALSTINNSESKATQSDKISTVQ